MSVQRLGYGGVLGAWLALVACGGLAGCGGGDTSTGGGSSATSAHDDHGHDHGDGHAHDDHGSGEKAHDHAHDHAAHGPHGGHIIELGEEEYHAEWKHDDESGKVTFYILDAEMKKEVPITASELVIETKVGENGKEYKLAAVNPSEDFVPKASQFELEDKGLIVVLQAAGHEGTEATLKVQINDKPYSAKIEHWGHDHKH